MNMITIISPDGKYFFPVQIEDVVRARAVASEIGARLFFIEVVRPEFEFVVEVITIVGLTSEEINNLSENVVAAILSDLISNGKTQEDIDRVAIENTRRAKLNLWLNSWLN